MLVLSRRSQEAVVVGVRETVTSDSLRSRSSISRRKSEARLRGRSRRPGASLGGMGTNFNQRAAGRRSVNLAMRPNRGMAFRSMMMKATPLKAAPRRKRPGTTEQAREILLTTKCPSMGGEYEHGHRQRLGPDHLLHRPERGRALNSLIEYFRSQKREQLEKEYNTYNELDNRFFDYQKLALEHYDLNILDVPNNDPSLAFDKKDASRRSLPTRFCSRCSSERF